MEAQQDEQAVERDQGAHEQVSRQEGTFNKETAVKSL
jgi:hypothetical protein